MSNNFRKTAFLKKNINCKRKLQSGGLQLNILGAYLCLNFSRGLLQIFNIFVCNFSRGFLTDKCIENFEKLFQVFSLSSSACNALIFFQQNPFKRVKLQFTTHIFLRKAVLRKLLDIRFSYKHCNFSRFCLLVKVASKTVARSIVTQPLAMLHETRRDIFSKY